MPITLPEIKKIAQLSRLNLTPEEEVRFAETISSVLDYMTILNEVDTSNVAPTAQVTGLINVARPDELRSGAPAPKLIAEMPLTNGNELVVPGVFEQSSET